MTTRSQGLALPSPADLLKLNPAYYIGQKVGQALTNGGAQQPQPSPTPPVTGDMAQGGAAGGIAGMDKTTMILIGAGVVATGIIIYAVATAKRRRR